MSDCRVDALRRPCAHHTLLTTTKPVVMTTTMTKLTVSYSLRQFVQKIEVVEFERNPSNALRHVHHAVDKVGHSV